MFLSNSSDERQIVKGKRCCKSSGKGISNITRSQKRTRTRKKQTLSLANDIITSKHCAMSIDNECDESESSDRRLKSSKLYENDSSYEESATDQDLIPILVIPAKAPDTILIDETDSVSDTEIKEKESIKEVKTAEPSKNVGEPMAFVDKDTPKEVVVKHPEKKITAEERYSRVKQHEEREVTINEVDVVNQTTKKELVSSETLLEKQQKENASTNQSPDPYKIHATQSRLAVKTLPKTSITYRINRKKTLSTITFTLFHKDEIVACAKGKSVSTSKVFIKLGSDIHLSLPPFDGIVTVEEHIGKLFKLYRGNKENEDNIIMISKTIPGGNSYPTKELLSFIGDVPTNYVTHLNSRIPTYNEEKDAWLLDFNGKFAMKSVKNCILDGEGLKGAVIIRKTMKDDIEVEIHMPIDPLYIMMFGLTVYMC